MSSKKSRDLDQYFDFEKYYVVPHSCKVPQPGLNWIYDGGGGLWDSPGLFNVTNARASQGQTKAWFLRNKWLINKMIIETKYSKYPSKICGRQPLKKLKGYSLLKMV